MSPTVLVHLTSLTLTLLSVLNLSYAVKRNVDPPECANFPPGCRCTTQNISIGGVVKNEANKTRQVVATVICNDLGLTEVPDFSEHIYVGSM